MAAIAPTTTGDKYPTIIWTPVTESDTADAFEIPGGEYTVEVKGTFGGATVDIQYGTASGSMVDIDTDAAPAGGRFTAQGVANLKIAPGFIKPDFSGGSSQSLTVTVRPLTNIKD